MAAFATMQEEPEDDTPSVRNMGTSRRQTEPAHYLPNTDGGYNFIPRRNADIGGMMSTKKAIQRMAGDTPLQLLTYLVDIHPSFSLAAWQALRLTAPPDGLRIVAVSADSSNSQQAGAEDQDDEGTKCLDDLWKSLPKEVGGLQGIQETLTLWSLLTGLPFLEAVPGASGKGLRQVWPIDSLTIRFNREGPDRLAQPYQFQKHPTADANQLGYVRLNANRMFWRAMDTFPDDPYGRAPYAAALGEVLRDLAMMADLTEAIHSTAYPVPGMPFNFAEMYKVAVEVYKFSDPVAAANWVTARFQETVREFNKRNPGDALHFDSSDGAEPFILEGSSGFQALEAILTFLRQRITQSLKTLPTLMGVNDGSTQTYTSVEWALYAAGLESLRAIVVGLIVEVATLHLRLLGLPLKAKAIYEPIRTSDAKIDAETEEIKIRNEKEKRDQGWQDQDTASQNVTGSDAVGDAPEAEESDPEAGGDSTRPDDAAPPAQDGDQTPDERSSGKRRRWWLFTRTPRPKA